MGDRHLACHHEEASPAPQKTAETPVPFNGNMKTRQKILMFMTAISVVILATIGVMRIHENNSLTSNPSVNHNTLPNNEEFAVDIPEIDDIIDIDATIRDEIVAKISAFWGNTDRDYRFSNPSKPLGDDNNRLRVFVYDQSGRGASVTYIPQLGLIESISDSSSFSKCVKRYYDSSFSPVKAISSENDILSTATALLNRIVTSDLEFTSPGISYDEKGQWTIQWTRAYQGVPYLRDDAVIIICDESQQPIRFSNTCWSTLPESTPPSAVTVDSFDIKNVPRIFEHLWRFTKMRYGNDRLNKMGVLPYNVTIHCEKHELKIINPNNFFKRKSYGRPYDLDQIPTKSRYAIVSDCELLMKAGGGLVKLMFWIDPMTGEILGGDMYTGGIHM